MNQREFTRAWLRSGLDIDFYNLLINYFGSEKELTRDFLRPCDQCLKTHFAKGVYFFAETGSIPTNKIGFTVLKLQVPRLDPNSPIADKLPQSAKTAVVVTRNPGKTLVFPTEKYQWAADPVRRANGLLVDIRPNPNLKTVPVSNPIYILTKAAWLVKIR